MIDLSNVFGLKVIGEGIETDKQAALLRDLGCDFGQGFFYSKALSAEAFESLIEKQGLIFP
jgi:EAL domain-containing protein (putative c-di-GMP-specific phosphodiesterase class I)